MVVLRRALPAALAVVAAIADGRGAHGLAFDALLCAIPFAAVAALEAFTVYLDAARESLAGLHALLWTLALALLVLSCAARSPATETKSLPALGWSALVACLAVFGVKAVLAVAPQLRRLAVMRPAKP